MAGSTTKKAVVQRFEKEALWGYLNPFSFLQLTGVELLSAEGNLVVVPYADVKTVSFVREFESTSETGRRVFHTRPKMEGLWVRLQFRDADVMEGILPNNLLQLESQGFTVIPPDPYSNNQRVFIPRTALRAVEVLGVVGSPLKKKGKPAPKEQIGLFEE
ncbi:MAG: hypothetical protein C5B51_16005 [Terriglobia bacterium]|nr:MAG: hypothetical protein C5B51_16005 [Terriglobia bacterium]